MKESPWSRVIPPPGCDAQTRRRQERRRSVGHRRGSASIRGTHVAAGVARAERREMDGAVALRWSDPGHHDPEVCVFGP
jgi:hypothetical protein